MTHSELAILYPVCDLHGNDVDLSTSLWAQTTRMLQPSLGKICGSFQPASEAWGHPIHQPYGVVFGRTNPDLFLALYFQGRAQQEKAMQFHLDNILKHCDLVESFSEDQVRGFTADPKTGCEREISAHLFWHLGMMQGEIFPDAGLYYAPARQAVIGEKLHEQILKNAAGYAIVAVRFDKEATMRNED